MRIGSYAWFGVLVGLLGCGGSATPASKPKTGSSGSTSHADAGHRPGTGAGGAGGSAAAVDAAVPDAGADGGGLDAAANANPDATAGAIPGCPSASSTSLPNDLACTGLYADIASKTLAPSVRAFTPAEPLWSDGAEKTRWVFLPDGMPIDGSDPSDWKLPIGTKLWKEFKWNGHRAETRLFWKVSDILWVKTAYLWNADETAATRFAGGTVDVAGDSYYVPSPKECDQCHKGRTDRALGFEAILLGLDGAQGLTLAQLVSEGLLVNHPGPTHFTIGDDGSGKAAPALGWLHVNCGVSCHNGNPASEAYKTMLRMRLSATELDGSSTAGVDARTTTLGLPAMTPRWSGQTIITAGSPSTSLLFHLIDTRDPANPNDQMPPIASRRVDAAGTAAISDWITALSSAGPGHAGAH